MSHSSGIISAPIDVRGDIAAVLGLSSGDVWTLYNSNLVKMFSKKKPVRWSSGGVPSHYPQNGNTDWWKGVAEDCGIISQSADTTNLLARMVGGLNGWTYERDPLVARVLDFEGYNHAAINPFDYLRIEIYPTSVEPSGTVTVEYQLSNDIGGTYQLGIFDLKAKTPIFGGQCDIGDLYPAVVIYDSSNNYVGWYSASVKIGALQSDPAMHSFSFTAPSTQGTYQYVPVLTKNKKESASQAIGDIVTIPGASVGSLTVAQNVLPYMQVDAFVYNSGTGQNPNYGGKIYFYCEFFGGSNGGQFNNISLTFETSGGVGYKTLSNVQNGGTAGNLTVAANSSVRKPNSSDIYSTNWTSGLSLETFIRELGGRARIYPGTGSTIPSYTITIREAAAMPGGNVIPF